MIIITLYILINGIFPERLGVILSALNCVDYWSGIPTLSGILKWMHDDVIKWKHFLRYWPFVWGIHRPLVNSPHKGQWRGALKFSLICVWINGWVNNREAGDLRRHRAHYDVIVMGSGWIFTQWYGDNANELNFKPNLNLETIYCAPISHQTFALR